MPLVAVDHSRSAEALCADFVTLLKDLGYATDIVQGNVAVSFKRDALIYALLPDAVDNTYVRLVVPNIFHFPDSKDQIKTLTAAAKASAYTRVAKIILAEPWLHCVAEFWSPDMEYTKKILPQAINVCTTACLQFAENNK